MVSFTVTGLPGPQGSKRAIPLKNKSTGAFTGKVNVVESSKKVKPWREDVRAAAATAVPETIGGAVNVSITFYLPRPKGHYGTGRNAKALKASAPLYPAAKPDIDKLVRSTLDALTSAGAYTDDSVVVDLHTAKRYADQRAPGAWVQIIPKANVRLATGAAA